MARSWVIVLFALGCTTRSLAPPERTTAAPLDLATSTDASARTDAAVCVAHRRVPVAVSSLSLVGGGTTTHFGSSARILVEYPLRAGCDLPSELATTYHNGDATDFLEVSASVWQGDGACDGAATTVRRVVVVPVVQGENPRLTTYDKGSTGARLDVMRIGGPTTCVPTEHGQACTDDCGCMARDAEARCLALPGGARVCGRSCTEDIDCHGSEKFCVPGEYRCTDAATCRDAASCAVGMRLVGCRCEIIRDDGAPCRCDAECAPGRICNGSYCVHPCSTQEECGAPCAGLICGVCNAGGCMF